MPNKDIKDHASLGGKKRAESLTAQQRSESASIAAKARWKAYNIRKNHVCDFGCRCKNCGAYINRHSKYSECQDPKCQSL